MSSSEGEGSSGHSLEDDQRSLTDTMIIRNLQSAISAQHDAFCCGGTILIKEDVCRNQSETLAMDENEPTSAPVVFR